MSVHGERLMPICVVADEARILREEAKFAPRLDRAVLARDHEMCCSG